MLVQVQPSGNSANTSAGQLVWFAILAFPSFAYGLLALGRHRGELVSFPAGAVFPEDAGEEAVGGLVVAALGAASSASVGTRRPSQAALRTEAR